MNNRDDPRWVAPGDDILRRFEDLYDVTADRIMAYCLRLAGPSEAEDAVAETFTTAWRKVRQIPDPPLPWLYVTARTTVLAQRRKQQRQGQVARRVTPLTQLAAHSPDVDHERRTELLTVLETLPELDREAILLTLWDGLTTQQAADVLGITPGALRVRTHRARTRLRANPDLMELHHA